MSCPREWEIGAYADDGLPAAERRALEAHLVACARCRGVVLALQDEARVLNAALRGAPAPAAAELPADVPARGFAHGLPLALGLSLAVTTAGSLLLEAPLPSGLGWLHPSRLLGVNDMILRTLFAVRDRAEGWLEFAVALALLATLAAIGAIAAGALLRRVGGAALLVLPVLLLAPQDAEAKPELRKGEVVRVAADERIDSSLVLRGDEVGVDGAVAGDLLAMADHLELRGVVEGNVIATGHELEIAGEVRGNLFVFAGDVRVSGRVLGSVYAFTDDLTFAPGSFVAQDAASFGDRIRLEGKIARDFSSFADDIDVTGEVGRDFTVWGDAVALASGAVVGRDLEAHTEEPDDLVVDAGARVAGETRRIDRGEDGVEVRIGGEPLLPAWERHLLLFAAALVFGMALHLLVPGVFRGSVTTGEEFFVALGLGLLALVGVPIALVCIALTLIGLPVALLGGAAYLVALYLGGIVVAVLIGRSVTRIRSDRFLDFGLALVVGLLIVRLVTLVPVVGAPLWVILHLVGLGLLVRTARRSWRAQRAVS